MPTSRSNHSEAAQEILSNPQLMESFLRIHTVREGGIAAVINNLPWLLGLIDSTNCMVRDAVHLTVRDLAHAEADRIPALVRPLLASKVALRRAEGLHLLGALPYEKVACYLPVVMISILDPDQEIRERARQALKRLTAGGASMEQREVAIAAAIRAILEEAFLHPLTASATAVSDKLLIEAFKLAFAGRAGESEIAVDYLRSAVNRVLAV